MGPPLNQDLAEALVLVNGECAEQCVCSTADFQVSPTPMPTPSPTPTPTPTPSPTPSPRTFTCGVAVNQGNCSDSLAYLTSLDSRANSMSCFGYGGVNDPCSLSITSDTDFGMGKNPQACNAALGNVLFLWDEPSTQCDRGFQSCGSSWAPEKWKAYANRWRTQLIDARADGLRITTPLLVAGSTDEVRANFDEFFRNCGLNCSDPSSIYYIDILAFNVFVTANWPGHPVPGQFAYARKLAVALRAGYPRRSIFATNFGVLKADQAAQQAAAIADYGFFGGDTQFSGVYYFAARDYCGDNPPCTVNNYLWDVVESGPYAGQTLGQVLVGACYR